jgi:hypothetical protein
MTRFSLLVTALNCWLMISQCHAFYLPGVNPQSFDEGDV